MSKELIEILREAYGYTTAADSLLPERIKAAIKTLEAQPAQGEAVAIPPTMNSATAKLVLDFASALAAKLHAADEKYGHGDSWMLTDWRDKCTTDMQHHIAKGDPRDVAAYCAFMWHHGWSTTPPDTVLRAEYEALLQHASEIAEYRTWLERRVGILTERLAKYESAEVVSMMVDRFLVWRLPEDFAPDSGISFKPIADQNCWPIGTNLLHAGQAKAMLEHCLAGIIPRPDVEK